MEAIGERRSCVITSYSIHYTKLYDGLLVAELAIYGWHRALHGSDILWRGLHQWHHSAERIDAASAFRNNFV